MVLLGASLIYAVRQVWGAEKLDPADTAALLGLPIAVAGLLAAVLALRRAPEGDLANRSRDWAATLATQIKKSEEQQWRQLLGNDTQRINLTFTVRAAPARAATVPADTGRLFDGTLTVPDVAAYYRQTRPRRLVVTGAAGSGKTVLALELMLALLEERGEDEPVPVRVSLAEWDTSIPVRELLVGRLVDVYDWPAAMADALVRHHRVLPVLDGLDEMDPTQPDGTPSPDAPRALAALDALNAYQEGRDAGPLVLTCRAAHYDALAPHTRLLDAARVDIDAVPALDAHAYLLSRSGTPARWEPVLTALRDDPTGPLATTLSTPWRLCLAATVYARDSDPAELLRHTTPEELDEHLLARFIPAASTLYPHPRYDTARVHRWLARLATHLDAPGQPEPSDARPGTDLVLHELWPLAGRLRVRMADGLLTATAALLPWISTLLLLLLLFLSTDPSLTDFYASSTFWGLLVCLLLVILTALVVALAFGIFAGLAAVRARQPVPRHLEWRLLRSRSGLRRFWAGLGRRLLMGLLWGISGGLAMNGVALALGKGPLDSIVTLELGILGLGKVPGPLVMPLVGLVLGCVGGVVGGVLGGLVDGASGEPAATASPRTVMRRVLPRAVLAGVASGFSSALVGTLLLSVAGVGRKGTATPSRYASEILPSWWPEDIALSGGIEIAALDLAPFSLAPFSGVAIGLAVGLAATMVRAAPLRRYAVFLICARGKLPWRLGAFLDWCCAAGLMRLSGTAYQFRHRELQQWLTDHPNIPAPAGN
ncbi:NACHT domain-containing protein [Streptomyces sp. NPDC000151]|uniref:NACHT domain-containing protein n=1 Tax=Streptomyces sp. NPDC000151 TaxID=3154244 RepID=UPI00331BF834